MSGKVVIESSAAFLVNVKNEKVTLKNNGLELDIGSQLTYIVNERP